jgi:hypothetical protein
MTQKNIIEGILSRAVIMLPKLLTRRSDERQCVFLYNGNDKREVWFGEVIRSEKGGEKEE